MGPFRYGQGRNILVSCSNLNEGEEFGKLHIKYGKNLKSNIDISLKAANSGSVEKVKPQKLRFDYIHFLQSAT